MLALAAGQPVAAQVPEIDRFIETALPRSGAPGIAYAVVDQGRVRSGARGELLSGGGQPVTPDTRFILGSISKSFTALGIVQLAEAGEVDVDAPLERYLAESRDGPSAKITLRQLLTHTSGFSTVQGNRRYVQPIGGADASSSSARAILQEGPAAAPGRGFAYSNANYRILGAVIEAVSGDDYSGFIATRIFQPLGMTSSFVSTGQLEPGMAVGHRPWFLAKRAWQPGASYRIAGPAGGIVSSANDMALYLAMMMSGEDDIVSAAGKAQMLGPSAGAAPGYGFGWNLVNGGETVYHTGTTPGVETQATMIPAERLGAIVLVNGGSGMGFGEEGPLIEGVTGLALGYDVPPPSGLLSRQVMTALLMLAPLLFALSLVWAWTHRATLRSKSGVSGMFSLWFPLLVMAGMTGTLLWLVPQLFGTTLEGLYLHLPGMVTAMVATCATGMVWVLARLAIALTHPRAPEGTP